MKIKNINFSTPILGLDQIEETKIQPSYKFIPEHFKNIPSQSFSTAKNCPSFVEIFKEGFVIPAPCDIWFKGNNKEKTYEFKCALEEIKISVHTPLQYSEYTTSNIQSIFKIDNVWYCETPKGYSIRQVPMIYHHNPNWYVAYGIIHTDMYSQINPQIIVTAENNEVFIKQGEPLCYIIPYKREKLNLKFTKFDELKRQKERIKFLGSFKSKYLEIFNKKGA